MATRQHRLSEFNQNPAPADQALELLCEDHNGTYVLPYACQCVHGEWRNIETGAAIEAKVVGWRTLA